MKLKEEIWTWIPGYKDYYKISLKGVKSIERYIEDGLGSLRYVKERLLKPTFQNGYLYYCLHKEGEQKVFTFSHLLLLTHVGPCPDGMVACHYDDNKDNNYLTNLRWDTQYNNIQDSIRNGKCKGGSSPGESNSHAKLTEEEVLKIRRLHELYGKSRISLAKRFNVSAVSISYIILRRTWRHI